MQKGTIFIADISGYSKFVRDTDIDTGAFVTSTLLKSMIDTNRLFRVSEVEGDAILFYAIGKPYKIQTHLQHFDAILQAFNRTKRKLQNLHLAASQLTLKSIIHFGDITEYSIGGHTKLYGSTVVEAHRLLKNSIQHNCYALITDDYLNATGGYDKSLSHRCEDYDIGKLSYSFLCFNSDDVIAA